MFNTTSDSYEKVADIEHKQIDGGWHQYTVRLRPGLNYSWERILASADYMADADLAPIRTVQVQSIWGAAEDLTKAYERSGSRFSKTEELTEEEGKLLSIGGISKTLGCAAMITWFNQIGGFGITAEHEISDSRIRRYAEAVAGNKLDKSAEQKGGADKKKNSGSESTRGISVHGIRKVTQRHTDAGENGMFPHGDSQEEAMEMADFFMGIRRYKQIYRYEIELDSAPLKWEDCLRAANNIMLLDVFLEHVTHGSGKLEVSTEKDVTQMVFQSKGYSLRRIPELKNESDFVAIRGSSMGLNVDIKVYFHNRKKLVTLYAPIADDKQIREYAATKLCRMFGMDISRTVDEETEAHGEDHDTGKAGLGNNTASPADFVIKNGVLEKYTARAAML